jgi:hypothetical protein
MLRMNNLAKKAVERGAKTVRRRTNIQHVLLRTIATAGVLSVALLAPNALQVLRMFDGGKSRRMNPKYLFGSAFEKLLNEQPRVRDPRYPPHSNPGNKLGCARCNCA